MLGIELRLVHARKIPYPLYPLSLASQTRDLIDFFLGRNEIRSSSVENYS